MGYIARKLAVSCENRWIAGRKKKAMMKQSQSVKSAAP